MRLAALGSGGIGGYYGALLANSGHDVTLSARGAHLEALQQRGVTVRTPDGESTISVNAVAESANGLIVRPHRALQDTWRRLAGAEVQP